MLVDQTFDNILVWPMGAHQTRAAVDIGFDDKKKRGRLRNRHFNCWPAQQGWAKGKNWSVTNGRIAEVEVLCGRAARMAYLTEYELEQLIEENRFILESMPVFSRDSLPVPPRQSASIHSVNLHNIITPLLQIIQTGPIVILDNQLTGCQVHLFRIFDEIWITFRGTNMKDIGSLRKDMKTDLNFSQRHPSYLPESHQAHRGFDESMPLFFSNFSQHSRTL